MGLGMFLVLIYGLVFWLVPPVAINQLEGWYAEQGQGYQLDVGGWTLSPFSGRIDLQNIELHYLTNGRAESSKLDFVGINLNLSALFQKRFHIQSVDLTGLRLSAGQQEDQLMEVAGLRLPSEPQKEPEAIVDDSESLDNTPISLSAFLPEGWLESWAIQLDSITFSDNQLSWSQPELHATLSLDSLTLSQLDTQTNQPVFLTIALSLQALEVQPSEELKGVQPTQEHLVRLQEPFNIKLGFTLSDLVNQPSLSGSIDLDALNVQLAGVESVQFESLSLAGLAVALPDNQPQISLTTLMLKEAKVVQSEDVQMALSSYEIEDIQVDPRSLTTGLHRFYGLTADIQYKPEQPEVVAEPVPTSTPQEPIENEDLAAEEALAFVVKVKGLELLVDESTAAQPSQIHFTDKNLDEPVSVVASIKELSVGQLDTQDLTVGVPFHFLASLDEYNRIQASGKMGVKANNPEGQMSLTIRQLNLTDFNPYLVQSMGYRLQKGMFSLDADIGVQEAELDGLLNLTLQNSKFEPADQETIDRVSKKISMPVETAISVLKDGNNNLNLEVPLSGNINDPNVGLNDLADQLARKALKQASIYYLKQSLQPYTSMISLASFVGKKAFAIRLHELEFAHMQLALTDEHKGYLQKVAEMMHKKTELELQVCPVITEAEQQAWGDSWASYAEQRATLIKAHMAQRQDQNGRALSARITLCEPEIGKKSLVQLGV